MNPKLKVAFEALSKDAATWDAAGETLETAKGTVDGVRVDRGAFSFAAMDVADTYLQLHGQVTQLLGEGATATRAGADALIAVRNDFERLEDVTKSDLYSLWQPVQ